MKIHSEVLAMGRLAPAKLCSDAFLACVAHMLQRYRGTRAMATGMELHIFNNQQVLTEAKAEHRLTTFL
ncbi:unnamed protein product [Urochloa humidicola]